MLLCLRIHHMAGQEIAGLSSAAPAISPRHYDAGKPRARWLCRHIQRRVAVGKSGPQPQRGTDWCGTPSA